MTHAEIEAAFNQPWKHYIANLEHALMYGVDMPTQVPQPTQSSTEPDWDDISREYEHAINQHDNQRLSGEQLYRWIWSNRRAIRDALRAKARKTTETHISIDHADTPAPRAPAETVHIYAQGRAFCDIKGVPYTWPKGHTWVGIADANHANCEVCILRYASDPSAAP